MKTLEEANEVLSEYWPRALARTPYTLDYITRLMDYLGNPQDKLKVIHVAGTSGKTSTCYYAAALLKAAGKKVGLTVSPHTYEINERVQIDLVPLSEVVFCRELDEFLHRVKQSGITITYFELLVAFAYWEFARQGVDYAVVEVGMGGLVDGTNIVSRSDKVCVITDIGFDHMTTLGNALGEIAEQKAGIIQLHNSVLCYRQDAEVMHAIEKKAKQKQADLHTLGSEDVRSDLASLPLFQQRNLGLAARAVDRALERHEDGRLDEAMVAEAAGAYIPGRMEPVPYHGRTIIFDGAHNAQKLHALRENMQRQYNGQPIAAVVSFAGGREYRLDEAVKQLVSFIDHIIITSFGHTDTHHSSNDSRQLLQMFTRHGAKSVEVADTQQAALDALLQRPEPVLMVTGSLYLIGYIRRLLRD